MFKKLLLAVFSLLLAALAHAAVDVNKADQAALDGIRGIGPAMSKRILDERQKGGEFKDWSDLRQRVKGIKDKSAAKLSANGLTVNGKSMANTANASNAANASHGGKEGRASRTDKTDKADKTSKADPLAKDTLARQGMADNSAASAQRK